MKTDVVAYPNEALSRIVIRFEAELDVGSAVDS
jgi:hypothetical protein